jgi:predicted dienelactone hydrolase
MLVVYPASVGGTTQLGPYTLEAASGAVPAPGPSPVVVISHGSGGAPLTHRGLALHLARAGFVVLAPEHAGNNRNDNSRANTAAILEQRPRDLHAALAWVSSSDGLGSAADLRRVGVVGHSLGGYTALALAGGRPRSFAHEALDAVARPVQVLPDPRVAAVVLLAPATPWFMAEGALDEVRTPILMFTGELDRQTPAEHRELIEARLAARGLLDWRAVNGAGHYSFLTPFPLEMTSTAFSP